MNVVEQQERFREYCQEKKEKNIKKRAELKEFEKHIEMKMVDVKRKEDEYRGKIAYHVFLEENKPVFERLAEKRLKKLDVKVKDKILLSTKAE
jgi:hypothetical protein